MTVELERERNLVNILQVYMIKIKFLVWNIWRIKKKVKENSRYIYLIEKYKVHNGSLWLDSSLVSEYPFTCFCYEIYKYPFYGVICLAKKR
jgi:hypothetical protein